MWGTSLNLKRAVLIATGIAGLGATVRFGAYGAYRLPSGSPAPQTANDLFQAAQSDITKGNYSAAIEKFRQMLKLDPNSPEAWSDLGVAYSMGGEHQQAVEAFERALQLDPSTRSANLMLGIELVRLGKPEDAIPHLELVVKQQPADADALSALASALFGAHQFEKAADAFRRETQLEGKAPNAWYGMGICFEHVAEDSARRLGGLEKGSAYYHELVGEFLTSEDTGGTQLAATINAEKELRSALEASGNAGEGFHAALGFALLKAGDVSHASAEFETEMRLHPGSLDGRLGLAAVALARSDFAAAAQSLCAIDAADEGYYESHLTALVASLGSNAESALAGYLGGLQVQASCRGPIESLKAALSPTSSVAGLDRAFEPLAQASRSSNVAEDSRRAQGRAEFEAGHYTLCAQALARSPNELLARCAFLSGHFLVAYDAARSLLAGAQDSAAGTYWKAEAAKKLSQSAFQKAVLTSPDSWQGHVLMGDIYRQQSKWDLAISEYEAAGKLMPTSPAAELGLGTIYWQRGENGLAESALRKALQLDASNPQANFELADVLLREHRFEDAAPYLELAVKQRPDFLAAHADLAKVYIARDNTAQAMAELLKALPTDQSGDLHYQLYLLYKKQGMTEQAQTALEQSQKLRADALKTQQENLEKALHASKGPGEPRQQ